MRVKMSVKISSQERVLAYLQNEMNDDERAAFEAEQAGSEPLREELARAQATLVLLEAAGGDAVAAQTVNRLIETAIARGASDLHVVPEADTAVVSLRVDGALRQSERLPGAVAQAVADRFKALTNLNLGERRVPQEGQTTVRHAGKEYDLRVSVLPTVRGERVAVRLLSRSGADYVFGLENLGLSDAQIAALRRLARRPSGLVLVVGKPGAGKTTLLYSLLLDLQRPELVRRSLLSIEEPVEMLLPGVAQTSVSATAGLSFAAALRALRRADADVILCGALPDGETAQAALASALSGTLVLSALSVPGGALSVVDRLAALGVERPHIADALAGAVALRLVRRVCSSCPREEYEPALGDLQAAGLSPLEDGPFVRGSGCETCGGTGLRGRVPLLEVFEVDTARRRQIAGGATTDDLWPEFGAAVGGSLWDDARAKIRSGLTTVEETAWALFDYPQPQHAPTFFSLPTERKER